MNMKQRIAQRTAALRARTGVVPQRQVAAERKAARELGQTPKVGPYQPYKIPPEPPDNAAAFRLRDVARDFEVGTVGDVASLTGLSVAEVYRRCLNQHPVEGIVYKLVRPQTHGGADEEPVTLPAKQEATS